MKCVLALVAFFLVSTVTACQTIERPKFLGLEKADQSYSHVDFPFKTSVSGDYKVPVYFKVFNSNGKLAVCGYYINRMTGCDKTLTDNWFDASVLYIGDKPVGSLGHLDGAVPQHSEDRGLASCVEYSTPFKPEYASEPKKLFRFEGRDVRAIC